MRVHHFTIDVEDWYHVSALEPAIPRERWPTMPDRLEPSLRRLMALLDRYDTRATLFVLGCVVARHGGLIRELAEAGHEIASHGWDHRRVPEQDPAAFRESVRRTRAVLEQTTGRPVLGFRAPSFSLVPGTEWALDVLIEEGYVYDSSLFPIRRRGYGYPGTARDPHPIERAAGRLLEVPPATVRAARSNVPAAGGAWFRLLPWSLTRAAFRQAERRGAPVTFYTHPWEIDAEQPRVPVSAATRVRHYGNLGGMLPRLERLLKSYRFQPIALNLGLTAPVAATS